jgi:hypothetical protein
MATGVYTLHLADSAGNPSLQPLAHTPEHVVHVDVHFYRHGHPDMTLPATFWEYSIISTFYVSMTTMGGTNSNIRAHNLCLPVSQLRASR